MWRSGKAFWKVLVLVAPARSGPLGEGGEPGALADPAEGGHLLPQLLIGDCLPAVAVTLLLVVIKVKHQEAAHLLGVQGVDPHNIGAVRPLSQQVGHKVGGGGRQVFPEAAFPAGDPGAFPPVAEVLPEPGALGEIACAAVFPRASPEGEHVGPSPEELLEQGKLLRGDPDPAPGSSSDAMIREGSSRSAAGDLPGLREGAVRRGRHFRGWRQGGVRGAPE